MATPDNRLTGNSTAGVNKSVENAMHELSRRCTLTDALTAVCDIDIDFVTDVESRDLITAIIRYASEPSGPLFLLSLPPRLQAEIRLNASFDLPGIDANSYLKATPRQVIRRLIRSESNHSISVDRGVDSLLFANYSFAKFSREDWKLYFDKCKTPIPQAKNFLVKDEAAGGFSDSEVTDILLRNHSLVSCMPMERITPNVAVALLISGRSESLWRTYNFARLNKSHWRELFLHTNPIALPKECEPFIENKDGSGFNPDELLVMAKKCHALINLLNPDKVPFADAYELYLTGRADLLWNKFPFGSLDKSEWRKILSNPAIKIPPEFADVAKSGRFKIEELCELSVKNDRLHPFLVELNVPPEMIIKVLLSTKAEYVWEHYRFLQFTLQDWDRLIFGLSTDEILRPRAMAALKSCKGITEAFTTKVLSRNAAYAPNLPIATISPDVAVDILLRGKGYFLWSAYSFDRLNDDQWLRLLIGTNEPISEAGITFLKTRAGFVDILRIESLLLKRNNLVSYVDAKYISARVASYILPRNPSHELWERYDFSRIDRLSLRVIVNGTKRTGTWPVSLVECFQAPNKPFEIGDLLEMEATNPGVAVGLISSQWVASMDDDVFAKLMQISVRDSRGLRAVRSRFLEGDKSWAMLPRQKLMRLLIVAPEMRSCVSWKSWSYREIAELAKGNSIFESEVPNRLIYFIWKHWLSMLSLFGITAACGFVLYQQHLELEIAKANRLRWNKEVGEIQRLDNEEAYSILRSYVNSLRESDAVIVTNDLVVAKALSNLTAWEARDSINASRVKELGKLHDSGWSVDNEDRAKELLEALESDAAEKFSSGTSYLKLKDNFAVYSERRAREKKIEDIRTRIRTISVREDLAEKEILELEGIIIEATRYSELLDEVSKARQVCEKRREALRLIEIRKNIKLIRNEIGRIKGGIAQKGAYKKLVSLKHAYDCVPKMKDFSEYRNEHANEYDELADVFQLFETHMKNAKEKMLEVDRLRATYGKALLTASANKELDSIVSSCDSSIVQAKGKAILADSVDEYQSVKDAALKLRVTDKECRALIEKMNEARAYKDYNEAWSSLVFEFGDYKELKSLKEFGSLSEIDLNRTYSTGGFWSTGSSYKYHFVGSIKIPTDGSNAVRVSADRSLFDAKATLHTIIRNSKTGALEIKRMFYQDGSGKYFKASGINYDEYKGAPLFVTTKEYRGEVK